MNKDDFINTYLFCLFVLETKIYSQGERSIKTDWLLKVSQKHKAKKIIDYYILIKYYNLSENANFISRKRPCP